MANTPKYFDDRNAVIYTDQTWTAPASVAGETLSVNVVPHLGHVD